MRSQIFAKSLPMPFVIGGLKRLSMLRDNPEHKEKTLDNSECPSKRTERQRI